MALSPRSARRNPARFEANSDYIHTTMKEILPSVLEKMTWGTDEKILDHGNNSGKKALEILAPIAEKYDSTVYILDNCLHTLDHAETNYSHAKIKHILGELDVPLGTLGDLKFNKVFSLFGLYFTPNYRSALQSMYDHLLPGGEGFFLVMTKSLVFDLNRILSRHAKWGEHAEEHFPVPDYADDGKDYSDKLKQGFIDAGFELKEFVMDNKVGEFKNCREIADCFLAANPFLLQLPKDEHDELEELYYKYFAETPTELYKPGSDSADGKYFAPYTRAQVFVRKPENLERSGK